MSDFVNEALSPRNRSLMWNRNVLHLLSCHNKPYLFDLSIPQNISIHNIFSMHQNTPTMSATITRNVQHERL